MKSTLVAGTVAALISLSAPSMAATYPFQGPLYDVAVGPYTTNMRITGSIETSEPLPANSPVADRTAVITAYSFNDGVVTLDQTNSQLCSFTIGTDAVGSPSSGFTTINGLPGGTGSNAMDLSIGANPDPLLYSNYVSTGSFILPNGLCTNNVYDVDNNYASAVDGLGFVGALPATQLPALSPLGLLLLAGGVVAVGGLAARRKARS